MWAPCTSTTSVGSNYLHKKRSPSSNAMRAYVRERMNVRQSACGTQARLMRPHTTGQANANACMLASMNSTTRVGDRWMDGGMVGGCAKLLSYGNVLHAAGARSCAQLSVRLARAPRCQPASQPAARRHTNPVFSLHFLKMLVIITVRPTDQSTTTSSSSNNNNNTTTTYSVVRPRRSLPFRKRLHGVRTEPDDEEEEWGCATRRDATRTQRNTVNQRTNRHEQ